MKVLISINPEHVKNIFNGTKIFEFRRKVFAKKDVTTAMIYCTRPTKLIVGEFAIDAILEDNPEEIWKKTQHGAGVTKSFFDKYFLDRQIAYALKIGSVQEYTNYIDPNEMFYKFSPPQSYMYIK